MKIFERLNRKLRCILGKDHVVQQGLLLPLGNRRLCGPEFQDDEYYLASAKAEDARLRKWCGLSAESRVLDIGCGYGRLAIGILAAGSPVADYQGFDVSEPCIDWCNRHFSRMDPHFHFTHIDVRNSRYHPAGKEIGAGYRLPLADASVTIINLYSVFSHMTGDHVRSYLEEFRRILAPKGMVFLTAFVEENVPDEVVNPEGYRMAWRGKLHCVRFSKSFFEGMLAANGLTIVKFDYETETDGQSGYYLQKG